MELVATQSSVSGLYEVWWYFRKNRGALIGLSLIVVLVLLALFCPLLSPHDPSTVFEGAYRLPPAFVEGGDARFFLGTDDVGRDLVSRLLHGARISLGVGFLVVVFSFSLGVGLGILAGYRGGWTDVAIMRLVDILMSLPSILLAIVVVAVLGPNLVNAVIAVSIVKIPHFIRLSRASVMSEKQKDYVKASKSFGASGLRQALVNVLPNCMAPLIVQATLAFSDGVLDVAALGFLGLGAQPPTAEWGMMLADARPYLESNPWMVTMPGVCILVVVLAFNLLGDGLRDALDPKMKR